MRIFRFDLEVGEEVSRFQSSGITMAGILGLAQQSRIGCIFIDKDGALGRHKSQVPQLLCVVQGEGWVRGDGDDIDPHSVSSGDAVFWQGEEWHDAGSDVGMVGILIESPEMIPEDFMPERTLANGRE